MARLHYFDQPEPDPADRVLREAITQGIVTERCRLGGTLISMALAREERPCATCHCPRKLCDGPDACDDEPAMSSAELEHWARLFGSDEMLPWLGNS